MPPSPPSPLPGTSPEPSRAAEASARTLRDAGLGGVGGSDARASQRHRATAVALCAAALIAWALPAGGEDLPEYRLKAAILYNFALFTEWPAATGATLNLCIVGKDPFGADVDVLQGKPVGHRNLAVHRKAETETLQACDMVFIAPAAIGQLPRIVGGLRGRAVLTVADTPGAARHGGVALNLALAQGRITFEANQPAARAAGLELKTKLLRLATEVHQ